MATIARTRPASAHGVHWEYLVPIATVHVLALLALMPWCFSWSGVVLAAIATNFFGTLGINLCYHRLLAHRSLVVPRWLERTLATIAVCSLEDMARHAMSDFVPAKAADADDDGGLTTRS